jgi:hypothetical protein
MKYGTVEYNTLLDTAVHFIKKRAKAYPTVKSVKRTDICAVLFDRYDFFTKTLTNGLMQDIAQKVGGEYKVSTGGRSRIVFK